jgi:hypothetical protein
MNEIDPEGGFRKIARDLGIELKIQEHSQQAEGCHPGEEGEQACQQEPVLAGWMRTQVLANQWECDAENQAAEHEVRPPVACVQVQLGAMPVDAGADEEVNPVVGELRHNR